MLYLSRPFKTKSRGWQILGLIRRGPYHLIDLFMYIWFTFCIISELIHLMNAVSFWNDWCNYGSCRLEIFFWWKENVFLRDNNDYFFQKSFLVWINLIHVAFNASYEYICFSGFIHFQRKKNHRKHFCNEFAKVKMNYVIQVLSLLFVIASGESCYAGSYLYETVCYPCSPGYYCPDGVNQYMCPAGESTSGWGYGTCSVCSSG